MYPSMMIRFVEEDIKSSFHYIYIYMFIFIKEKYYAYIKCKFAFCRFCKEVILKFTNEFYNIIFRNFCKFYFNISYAFFAPPPKKSDILGNFPTHELKYYISNFKISLIGILYHCRLAFY